MAEIKRHLPARSGEQCSFARNRQPVSRNSLSPRGNRSLAPRHFPLPCSSPASRGTEPQGHPLAQLWSAQGLVCTAQPLHLACLPPQPARDRRVPVRCLCFCAFFKTWAAGFNTQPSFMILPTSQK